jgi:hypothetical protein
MRTCSTSEPRRPRAQAAGALWAAAMGAVDVVAPRPETAWGILPRRASSSTPIDSQRGMREFINGLIEGVTEVLGTGVASVGHAEKDGGERSVLTGWAQRGRLRRHGFHASGDGDRCPSRTAVAVRPGRFRQPDMASDVDRRAATPAQCRATVPRSPNAAAAGSALSWRLATPTSINSPHGLPDKQLQILVEKRRLVPIAVQRTSPRSLFVFLAFSVVADERGHEPPRIAAPGSKAVRRGGGRS